MDETTLSLDISTLMDQIDFSAGEIKDLPVGDPYTIQYQANIDNARLRLTELFAKVDPTTELGKWYAKMSKKTRLHYLGSV